MSLDVPVVSSELELQEERPLENEHQTALEELEQVLTTNFYKPDIQAIRVVLGTIQSHRLSLGDPAWLFVVAPPAPGKTTTSIKGASGLHDVVMLGDFSENAFLSGFHGHQQPGMLEKLGHTVQDGQTYTSTGNAVFMAKDFHNGAFNASGEAGCHSRSIARNSRLAV